MPGLPLSRTASLLLGAGIAVAAFALDRSGLTSSCETRLARATAARRAFWRDHAKEASTALAELSDSVSAEIAGDGQIHFFDAVAFGRQLRTCETDPSQCGPVGRTPAVVPTARQRDAARRLQQLLAESATDPEAAADLVASCPDAQRQSISNYLSSIWPTLRARYPDRRDILDTCSVGTAITSWQSSTTDGGRTWNLTPSIAWCIPESASANAT